MAFCSNCGAELKGARKFCSECGYRIDNDELEQIKKMDSSSKFEEVEFVEEEDSEDDPSTLRAAEIVATPVDESVRYQPGTQIKEKIPKSNNCSVCSTKTDSICFFCDWGICDRHSVKMKIKTDTGLFGNVIQSCPDCADRRSGSHPSQEEAAEVGFFFKIKPYHEWKIVK